MNYKIWFLLFDQLIYYAQRYRRILSVVKLNIGKI